MALLAVMWVVVIAGLMLLSVQNAARTHRALSHGELAAVQARWLARAGVEQALAILEDDDATVDGADEDWYSNASLFENVKLEGGQFSVRSSLDKNRAGLDDESARLNLNNADRGQLDRLKVLSDSQMDSLLQWRSPSAPGDPNARGAAEGYYQALKPPYQMRGKYFQTHREVLLVAGFENRSFFGPPASSLAAGGPAALTTVYSYQANQTPQGYDRININSASAQALQEGLNLAPALAQAVVQGRAQNYQNLSALLNVRAQGGGGAAPANSGSRGGPPPVTEINLEFLAGHAEELTISDDTRLPGRININTASRDVLLTLPGVSEELADQIIAQRGAANGAFKSLADLLQRNIIPQEIFKGIWEKLTVRSDVFSVECVGVSSAGVQRRIFAVIDRGSTPATIAYWCEGP